MQLTKRQLLTIKHLKEKNIINPLDIIKYCVKKIEQPAAVSYTKHFNAPRVPRRNHSRKYYQQIIDYLAQGGKI